MSEDEAINQADTLLKSMRNASERNLNSILFNAVITRSDIKAIETILDLYNKEKEKNKELEKAIKNSDIEILKGYIQYKIECFEKMLNGHIGDGARPEIQRCIDLLKDILEEAN